MSLSSSLFLPNPSCGGSSQPRTLTEALDLPNFNAMYQANSASSSAQNCKDEVLAEMFQKKVLNEMIRCGGAKTDIGFFETAFGWTERGVDAKEVWNHYDCDADYNVFFAETATPTGAGLDFVATLHRSSHSPDGKYSYPAKGFSLLDVDNNVWWHIEDKNTDNDFAHVVTLRPQQSTSASGVKKYKKFLVVPARFVGGYSCPMPTNKMPTWGYMQKVNPFRLRRDWHVKVDILRGYKDVLRWAILWDSEGNKVDAWDTYQAQEARLDLQLARNILAFLGTPTTNTDIINGTGATVVDDIHTGFYGYLPTLKFGGGNVLDFDPAIGYDLDADLEPFILSQDALKKSSTFNVRHGKAFLARLINRANKMVKAEGLGIDAYPAFTRSGEGALKKLGIKSYEWLGFMLNFEEWGALSDSRLLGSQYMSNMAIMTPVDGVTTSGGVPANGIEFYQYGLGKETGDYWEEMVDFRKVTLCDELKGSVAQSVMMKVHCPGNHILLNPTIGC